MIRIPLVAAPILLGAVVATASMPAAAQSQQELLDARYDRALAAGYKALMLCGAIASAERSGAGARSEASVLAYEMHGIQQPLGDIARSLPYVVTRWPGGAQAVRHVAVDWAPDMPPRIAFQRTRGGCSLGPIGMTQDAIEEAAPAAPREKIVHWHTPRPGKVTPVLEAAMGGAYGKGTRTTAVAVNWGKDGWDWRFADGFGPFTPQRTWSVAKSIAATLVGVTEHRGANAIVTRTQGAITAPPLPIFGWHRGEGDPRRAIAMDHLLRMASGRYSDTPGNRTDALYFGGASVDESALHWPLLHEPGSVFRYANNDTLTAVKAIAYSFDEHPPEQFFAKAGMDDTVAETDFHGDYVLSSQVWASTMDLIRFGQLYLNDGVLPTGERVLSEGWVTYVTTPSGPQPETGTFGYGAGFWLLNKETGVPADTFAAIGNRGQYVVIVPSRQVVIVRRGEDPAGSGFDIAGFTRDVLARLPQ